MHALLADHPDYAVFAKQRADAEAARDRFTAEATAKQKGYEAACAHALETGGRIPEAPQAAFAGEQAYRVRLEQIEQAERAWIAANADEVRRLIWEREDAVVAEASDIVATLDARVSELGDLRAVLSHVHQRSGAFGAPETTGTNFTLLIEAARSDTRLLRQPFARDFGSLTGTHGRGVG
jgi:hypothetical protein